MVSNMQPDLFSDYQSSSTNQPTSRAMHVSWSTFKGGLSAPVHRWFRLTPSFGPGLVEEMLNQMDACQSDVVLDPFSGASTTLIQCQWLGIESVGFEINPALAFVGKTSTSTPLVADTRQRELRQLEKSFTIMKGRVGDKKYNSLPFDVPPIHNIERWWRPDVIRDLLILRNTIENLPGESSRFFMLALLGVLVPDLTNVTLGRLQLHFIDRTNDTIDTWTSFKTHAQNMISDLRKLCGHFGGSVRPESVLLECDCTVQSSTPTKKRPSLIITSPPYPNRYSYVWNTRPHLYMGRFITHAKEASSIDLSTIGGTWGVATSRLSKGNLTAITSTVEEIVGPTCDKIRSESGLMANYCMKYFNLIWKQIQTLEAIATPQHRVAYVIGCSRLKGIYIETDQFLAKMLDASGYTDVEIVRFRKRNSGKDLHESIVYARRPS